MAETTEIVGQQEAQTAPTVEATPVATTPAAETSTAPEVTEQTPPSTETTPVAKETPAPQKTFEEILSEQGFTKEDIESFKAQKAKEKEESEKPFVESKRWADVVNFGVSQKLLTKEDVEAAAKIGDKADRDLVFEKYKSEFKNEDGLEGEELDEVINASFEEEYGLDVVSDKAKARAEAALKQEAANIRKAALAKVELAESQYTKSKTIGGLQSQHKEIFSQLSKETIKQTITVDGEELSVEVPFDVTEEEVVASLKSEEGSPFLNFMFGVYSESPETAAEMYKQYATSLALNKNGLSKIVEATWAKAEEKFKTKYSIGATQPFSRETPAPKEANVATEASWYEKNILKT